MIVAIGSKLAQFEILVKLGEGGMGEVFRARDTELGREVAIEVLPADMAAGPNRLYRFPREAKAVATLNHPGVVTPYRVQQDPGFHFPVLEPIEKPRPDPAAGRPGTPPDPRAGHPDRRSALPREGSGAARQGRPRPLPRTVSGMIIQH